MKEDVWDKFNYWYYKMGISEERMVDDLYDILRKKIEDRLWENS